MLGRYADVGNDATEPVIQLVKNAGSAGVTAVANWYGPMATASLPAAPPEGSLAYDLTLSKLVVFTGAAWEAVTSV